MKTETQDLYSPKIHDAMCVIPARGWTPLLYKAYHAPAINIRFYEIVPSDVVVSEPLYAAEVAHATAHADRLWTACVNWSCRRRFEVRTFETIQIQYKQMAPGTANFSPYPVAGCCHLANLMACYCTAITRLFWKLYNKSCNGLPVTLHSTNIVSKTTPRRRGEAINL